MFGDPAWLWDHWAVVGAIVLAILVGKPLVIALLARSIAMTITYWFNFDSLTADSESDVAMIHTGVLQVMSLVSPYLGAGDREFMTACLALYQEASS